MSKQEKKNIFHVNKTFLMFSCIFFLIISLIAFVAYTISARQINLSYIEQQLAIASETMRLRLATTVNSEILLVRKMADTPVIREHFLNPYDPELEKAAHLEFSIYQEYFRDKIVFWINDIDKIFYSTIEKPYLVDPDDPESYWYNLTLYRTEQHNLNINYNPDLGQINLWVNVPVFTETEDGGKKPVGILGTGINLTAFTNFIVSGESEFDKNIVPYMFNKFDEITSTIDFDLVNDKVLLTRHLGEAGREIIRIAETLPDNESHIFSYGRNMYLVSSIPSMEWFLAVSYPLPGYLALNQAMNFVFFGMLSLIFLMFIVINIFIIIKDRSEKILNDELTMERDVIQTMKDNTQQGIFLMNKEYRILPQYSQPLVSILSYHESELEGKNFLDILSASLDARQLQTMQSFFTMMFEKTKNLKVLESANPISEFDYKINNNVKTLSTSFHLIEQEGSEEHIIGIIQDITREKEFERELHAQRLAKELEMKNMLDVIQIDPLVFQDFIDDIEINVNDINSTLQDSYLTEKQIIAKLFQNVQAIKTNALSLGLETLGLKLHKLESEIKKVSDREIINEDEIPALAAEFETIMQEKDAYMAIVNKVESYKTSHRLDSVFENSLNMTVKKLAEETKKKVDLKVEYLDIGILESKLRKPIKDILLQCIKNSIYHGIETFEERYHKRKKPDGLLSVSIKKADDKAEITFSDDGRGLDWDKIKARYLELHPETRDISRKVLLSSIFSPNFSTSDEAASAAARGIGLSLVKDLVKENNGNINVNSTDSGLTLKFAFPLAS